MGLSMLLFVTLTVCFHSALSLDCTNSPGISYMPCQNPSASSGGGSGGTGSTDSQDNPTAIQPCADIQYNGRPPQRYTVEDQGLPEEFELVFDTLNIPDGDKLVIKSFKCGSNNECKIAVIDSTATTPFSVSINKHTFALASSSSSVSATFKVNYECTVSCESLSSIGYNYANDHKWLKAYLSTYNTSTCESLCDNDGTRLVTVKSDADAAALVAAMNAHSITSIVTILGLHQDSLTQYTWSDGTGMIVDPTNGDTDLPGGYKNWFLDGSYDKGAATMDGNTCFNYYHLSSSINGWGDARCSSMYRCVCECKY